MTGDGKASEGGRYLGYCGIDSGLVFVCCMLERKGAMAAWRRGTVGNMVTEDINTLYCRYLDPFMPGWNCSDLHVCKMLVVILRDELDTVRREHGS